MGKKRDRDIEQFKQGIFSLRTSFGEFAQLMVQKDMKLLPPDDNSYNLKDNDGRKIEVKFSRAFKKEPPITIEVFHAPRSEFPDSLDSFIEDKAAARQKLPGYSLQHKGGEECQFHIKKTTHRHHHEHYHVKDITYEELYDLLDSQK